MRSATASHVAHRPYSTLARHLCQQHIFAYERPRVSRSPQSAVFRLWAGLAGALICGGLSAQTIVPIVQSTVVGQPLNGVARTSTSLIASASTGGRYIYAPDLSSGSAPNSLDGVEDLGSWSDTFYLSLASGVIEKRNVSNNGGVGLGMSLHTARAVSSMFFYNGTEHIAIWHTDNQVKVYAWGNTTPVATLFDAGSTVTGMDIRVRNTNGVSSFATDLEFIFTRSNTFTYQSGTGALLGTYGLNSITGLNDVAYYNGVLTIAINDFGFQGRLYNVDFTSYQTAAIPEPATVALGLGAAALALAVYRRRSRA